MQATVIGLHDISQLKAVDQMKSDFVAVVSHELRAPLTTVTGSVETASPARTCRRTVRQGQDQLAPLSIKDVKGDAYPIRRIAGHRLGRSWAPTATSQSGQQRHAGEIRS